VTQALRRAAGTVVNEIATRLRDPATVLAHTQAALWSPQSLVRGYPSIALLYAELGHFDSDLRQVAHRYLELAARHPETDPLAGQLDGLCAVAAALRVAAHHESDYATLLARLDPHVIAGARRLIALREASRRAGEPTHAVVIDCLNGLAGLGRHLLGRSTAGPAGVLLEVLSSLSSLREPISWHGVRVPGWWYHRTPLLPESDSGVYRYGAAMFGLSHGLAGPLALLALAWKAGFRVPGQYDAVHAMTEWLLQQRQRDDAGWYWPALIPLSHLNNPAMDRPQPATVSWCHGSWGTARAVILAGEAFARPDWTAAAAEVVYAVLARCQPDWAIRDISLCHGWAAVLHQLCRFGWSIPHPDLAVAADDIARRLIDNFRDDAPFGYRYRHSSGETSDLPGMLEGAAGVALALHAYLTGRPPASGWDSILLLS